MKKHNLAEFLKSKSFYALLCVGALAIVVIAIVGLNQTSEKAKNNNLVDLNEPISDVAEGEDNSNPEIATNPGTNNTNPSTVANNDSNSETEVEQGYTDQLVTDGGLLDSDVFDDPKSEVADATQTEDVVEDTTVPEETASITEATDEGQAVMKPETLHFASENGLIWPVKGNVLMNYSVDRVIYFQTLEQFKCNPAVIIAAEIGTEVLSAAKGIITSITDESETGLTITVSLGSGFSLVYGQLQDVKVEVGDTIEEGTILGTIAKPSKYYSVEGSNLYFQVMKDEDTMNPMLLLRDK